MYLVNLTVRQGLSASEFLLYFTAVSGFTAWVTGILKETTTLRQESLDLSLLRQFLEYPEPFRFEGGKPIPTDCPYELRLENVTYRYPGADAETTGIFKSKERKAIEAKIETAEKRVSDLKDRISRMVQEQGYPDGQAFMAAYNKAERIVKQYEWALAEWKQQVEEKPAEEKKPPERKSVVADLRRIQSEAKKQPQKRIYHDRDGR